MRSASARASSSDATGSVVPGTGPTPAAAAGVGPVPGTTDPVASLDDARAEAERIGYPVAVKASGGGGGRGFRVAVREDVLKEAFNGSKGEAERYFGNPDVYP